MNILVTGCTDKFMAKDRRIIEVNPTMVDVLRSFGNAVHFVEAADVDPQERYDLRVLGVGPALRPWSSERAPHVYNLMNTHDPVILYFMDYQVNLVREDGEQIAVEPAGTWTYGACTAAYTLARGDWPQTWYAMVPSFPWGYKALIPPLVGCEPERLLCLDMSYLARQEVGYSSAPTGGRPPGWLLASLNDHRGWVGGLGLQWPVSYLGNRGFTEKLQTERDVYERYTTQRGALVPPYAVSGAGWFRARWVYAAMAGCVSAGDFKEATAIADGNHGFVWHPREVELLDDTEYVQTATIQRRQVMSRLGGWGTFVQTLTWAAAVAAAGRDVQW